MGKKKLHVCDGCGTTLKRRDTESGGHYYVCPNNNDKTLSKAERCEFAASFISERRTA